MSKVTLIDYSEQVKDMLQSEKVAWLHTWASEITSQAQRNCKMDDKGQLRGSYSNHVDESKGEATIGTPLEAGYWEEFGTGEHAVDRSKSRSGWWVYVKGQASRGGGRTYANEDEARAVAASMQAEGLDAYATNGRYPQHTLENAFLVTKPKMEADLQNRMNKK
jgi:hypothetical protein